MSELKKDSVERTLCIPLWSRAIAVKKLPQVLPDYDAVRILREMGETKPPTVLYNLECGALAGAIPGTKMIRRMSSTSNATNASTQRFSERETL